MAMLRSPLGLAVGALSVAVLVLLTPASAAAVPLGHSWSAPYAGTAYAKTGGISRTGCGTDTLGPSGFSLKTGAASAAMSVATLSCTTTSPSSRAVAHWTLGVDIRSFSGGSGVHPIRVQWTLSIKVNLSLSGSSCGAAPESSVQITLETFFTNLSSHAVSSGPNYTISHALTKAGKALYTIRKGVVLTWKETLDAADSYRIGTAIVPWIGVNLARGSSYGCRASGDLRPDGTSYIALLDSVDLT